MLYPVELRVQHNSNYRLAYLNYLALTFKFHNCVVLANHLRYALFIHIIAAVSNGKPAAIQKRWRGENPFRGESNLDLTLLHLSL